MKRIILENIITTEMNMYEYVSVYLLKVYKYLIKIWLIFA